MAKSIIFRLLLILSIISLSKINLCAQDLPVVAVIDNRSVEISHIAKSLDARLNSALNTAGIHSEGEEGLYLVAELIPISDETVETGMSNIKIKRFELSIRLEQPQLNLKFGQTMIFLEGSGNNPTKAAMNAIQQFNPAASGIQEFIIKSINKAHEYYLTHIDAIIDKAKVMMKAGDYDGAIALLWACPNSTSIHKKVYTALDEIYMAKQNHECTMILKQAESAYALHNYTEMKYLLDKIDANSQCASEARVLAKKAGIELRNEQKAAIEREERAKQREYAAQEKKNQRNYNLNKQRIAAIAEVAKAYARSQRTSYHYHIF